MKAWLYGGPFDGTALEAPDNVEAVTLWHKGRLHEYVHDGEPGEPDCYGPDVGVRLYHFKEWSPGPAGGGP